MQKLVKIAFANVIRNGKRSLLIGTAIFVSCALLLISGAFGNGAAAAIMNEYYSQQAGDVVLLWENALKLEKDSPSRIYLSQFDPQKAGENKKALARFAEFLRRHESEIRKAFPVVRRSATVVTADDMIDVNVYGLGSDEWRFLKPRKTIILEEGAFEATPDSSVIVSRLIADAAHLRVGDWMTLEVTTAYGVRNSLDYRIAGIYKNGVPWDNDYVYMSATDARLLYDFDPEDFDSTRIYLNDAHAGAAFAHELNAALGPARGVLQALEGQEASSFFTRQAGFFKNIFTIFVIFLTTIIGFGIRATVRMNLFERMSEFGTLRAIGFSRLRVFFLISCEVFLLAAIALMCAFVCSAAVLLLASRTGVHVGSEAASYLFGGEYLHPLFKLPDALFAFAVILILSLMAPFKPAMKLSLQKVSDILLKRQDRNPVTVMLIRSLFRRARSS